MARGAGADGAVLAFHRVAAAAGRSRHADGISGAPAGRPHRVCGAGVLQRRRDQPFCLADAGAGRHRRDQPAPALGVAAGGSGGRLLRAAAVCLPAAGGGRPGRRLRHAPGRHVVQLPHQRGTDRVFRHPHARRAARCATRSCAALREKQLRDERIVALGTQAALAAHELATPLATIQTTAHELAAEFANDPDIGADCRLLEKQAQACKRILTQLAARAQDTPPAAQPLDTWLAALVERWQMLRPDAQIATELPPDHRALHPARRAGAGDPERAEQRRRCLARCRRIERRNRRRRPAASTSPTAAPASPPSKRRRPGAYCSAASRGAAGAWAWHSPTPRWNGSAAASPSPNATAAAPACASPCHGSKQHEP